MEKIDWKVDGMTCSNCALSVTKYLKNEGMQDVKVNPISGAVSFTSNETDVLPKLKTGIKSLGYKVVNESERYFSPFASDDIPLQEKISFLPAFYTCTYAAHAG